MSALAVILVIGNFYLWIKLYERIDNSDYVTKAKFQGFDNQLKAMTACGVGAFVTAFTLIVVFHKLAS